MEDWRLFLSFFSGETKAQTWVKTVTAVSVLQARTRGPLPFCAKSEALVNKRNDCSPSDGPQMAPPGSQIPVRSDLEKMA